MSLPVSCYKELLAQVRSITEETKQFNALIKNHPSETNFNFKRKSPAHQQLNPLYLYTSNGIRMQQSATNNSSSGVENWRDKLSNPSQSSKPDFALWNSVGPGMNRLVTSTSFKPDDVLSGGGLMSHSYNEPTLGVKVDMVYGLISLLENHSREEMTKTLLAMSHSLESCMAMRQSGCIPLLVQLIHSEDEDCSPEIRSRAAQALHNVIHFHADDKQGRREVRVLRLLEKIRTYSETMTEETQHSEQEEIGQVVAALMKLSFDEDHRYAMCQLGALYTLAHLIQMDTACHKESTKYCIILRRYAAMTLTNLTFGHGSNKSTLCCLTNFMKALVLQLSTPSEHLRQVTASVLRNLSWRADAKSKEILRDVEAVPALMKAAMEATKESTLKSILSALWNFSAHCNNNKVDICNVEGALPYLIDKMKSSSQTSLAIVENAGGVMRNISSHIAVKENYRAILREHECLQLLLEQLRSPSLTVVSNACGTLWNLSAHCTEDQMTLWSLGAVPMLKSLIHSRHKMISTGASAALKNLLAAKPDSDLFDKGTRGMPSLLIRKRRALEKELDANLAETCDNIENSEQPSPITPQSTPQSMFTSHQPHLLASSTPLHNSVAPPVSSTTPLNQSSTNHNRTSSKPLPAASGVTSSPPDDLGTCSSQHQRHNSVADDSNEKPLDDNSVHNVSREDSMTENQRLEPLGTSCTPSTVYLNSNNGGSSASASSTSAFHDHDEEEQQREHLLYSKIEESYNLDDDAHEPINLDQPTNYSLRYTEKQKATSTSSSSNNNNATTVLTAAPPFDVEEEGGGGDCVRTFCTEDTPYNFSNSTSLSDLRITDGGELSACKTPEDSKPCSGRASPQKLNSSGPAAFDETPLMFSRCSSLGSLSSCDQHEPVEITDDRSSVAPEDRYSVVSEFSRMTSGMISPSELPDSPIQTAPVSPSPRGTPGNMKFTYPTVVQSSGGDSRKLPEPRSVFEDTVAMYKHDDEEEEEERKPVLRTSGEGEGTLSHQPPPPTSAKDELKCYAVEESPCNISAWSSLSDLTINTNTSVSKHQEDDHHQQQQHRGRSPPPREGHDDKGGPVKVEEEEETLNDEDILAQCIRVGMESAKTLTLKKNLERKESDSKREVCAERKSTHSDEADLNDEDILAKCIQLGMNNAQINVSKTSMNSAADKARSTDNTQLNRAVPPADPSRLQVKVELSDEEILQQCIMEGMSSYCQNTDESVLQQCIKAGMEKFKQEKQHKSTGKWEQVHNANVNISNESKPNSQLDEVKNQMDMLNLSEDTNPSKEKHLGNNLPETAQARDKRDEKYFDLDQWANDVDDPDSNLLLEQCIEAGIPYKSKNVLEPSAVSNASSLSTDDITTIQMTDGRAEPNHEEPESAAVTHQQDSSQKKSVQCSMSRSVNKLVKSELMMSGSMKESWKLDDHLNDDLCEGIMISSKCDLELMKDSMTHTWSEDTTSFPSTISLSPPSCMKQSKPLDETGDKAAVQVSTNDIHVQEEEAKKISNNNNNNVEPYFNAKINEIIMKTNSRKCVNNNNNNNNNNDSWSDSSIGSSPIRKSVAKVTPFPETTKIISAANEKEMDRNVFNEMKLDSESSKLGASGDPLILNEEELKFSSIIELDCGKLGIISSIDFEDLNSVKPPSVMESLTCLDKSMFNKTLVGSITSMQSSVNLDSIKPPSYFDEVSHILDMDSSICNIDSIVSEVADTGDDDLTLIEDDIPFDDPLDENLPQNGCRLQRKVTPKQKRNLSKERYNTYTIKSERLTPKQKRQQDKDRYATRTIADDDLTLVNHDTFVVAEDADSSTLMSGNVSEIEDFEMNDEEEDPACYRTYNKDDKTSAKVSAKPAPVQASSNNGSPKISKLQKPKSLNLHYKSLLPVCSLTETKPVISTAKNSLVKPLVPLQRQGTFTKDEPTTPISNIPVLSSFSNQSTPKKTSSASSIVGQSRVAAYSSKPRNNSQPNIKRNSGVKSSLSNNNLKGELSRDSKLNSSTPSLNRRSYIDLSSSRNNIDSAARMTRKSYNNSNSSLNSVKLNGSNPSSKSSATTVVSAATQPNKTQATSKIANLWKKVEDSKKQSGFIKKDNRVWITSEK